MADPRTVLCVYRFHPHVAEPEITGLLERHRTALVNAGLATDRLPTVLKSTNGSNEGQVYLEIFEWTEPNAPERAHMDPGVQRVWAEFEPLCASHAVPLAQLPEAQQPFAHFIPVRMAYEVTTTVPGPRAGKPRRRAAAQKKKAAPPPKRAAKSRGRAKASASAPKSASRKRAGRRR